MSLAANGTVSTADYMRYRNTLKTEQASLELDEQYYVHVVKITDKQCTQHLLQLFNVFNHITFI